MPRKSLVFLAALLCSWTAHAVVQAREGYTRNVAIVIWNGAELLDWTGPAEVFASASRIAMQGDQPAFRVYTVSKTKETIVSQGFVEVLPDYDIATAPRPDIIVLPGGGTRSIISDPEFLAWAAQAAGQAEIALSVCTGAFVLGESGLLDGKDATTWYNAVAGLARSFPEARVRPGRRFVDNGSVITTAGVSAGIDGSLHVVARLLGKNVADRTAEYMEYRWSPEAYVATHYETLNPSLDDRGRQRQQAEILAHDGFTTAAVELYRRLIEEQPHDASLRYDLAGVYYEGGDYGSAADAYAAAAKEERLRQRALYNAACSASRNGDADRAFGYLNQAVDAGLLDGGQLRSDEDLQPLHGDSRWKDLMHRVSGGDRSSR